ncbi:MAG: DUF2752 domain-containing protein [Firmicutes bacterium]|nr:DUF2752 domain-containing protein [[Eubacterium] siraeum]MCM1488425.1 DUF2752 domain-containing protein [Bacillota bacterium]
MRDRKIILKRMAVFLTAGIVYLIWLKITGLAIPCPIRTLCGFLLGEEIECPGCGVSRLCLALLRLDFKEAFYANPCIFILLPIWAVFILIRLIFAPKALAEGSFLNSLFYYAVALALIIFGIVRNLV